MNKIIEPYNF